MAGSYQHCLTDDEKKTYRGVDLLENMGDMKEGVEHMIFIILRIREVWGGHRLVEAADREYFECLRGERPWPDFMKPGIDR